eukprot:g57542.t1
MQIILAPIPFVSILLILLVFLGFASGDVTALRRLPTEKLAKKLLLAELFLPQIMLVIGSSLLLQKMILQQRLLLMSLPRRARRCKWWLVRLRQTYLLERLKLKSIIFFLFLFLCGILLLNSPLQFLFPLWLELVLAPIATTDLALISLRSVENSEDNLVRTSTNLALSSLEAVE